MPRIPTRSVPPLHIHLHNHGAAGRGLDSRIWPRHSEHKDHRAAKLLLSFGSSPANSVFQSSLGVALLSEANSPAAYVLLPIMACDGRRRGAISARVIVRHYERGERAVRLPQVVWYVKDSTC